MTYTAIYANIRDSTGLTVDTKVLADAVSTKVECLEEATSSEHEKNKTETNSWIDIDLSKLPEGTRLLTVLISYKTQKTKKKKK